MIKNLLGVAVFFCVSLLWGQTPSNAQQAEPAMVQIRKSVAFVELACKEGDKTYQVRGTGFFVSYPDKRAGEAANFVYFVTNKHVAFCWNDSGHPMQVNSIALRMNMRNAVNGRLSQEITLNQNGNVPWIFSDDASVDLAVVPFGPDPSKIDFKVIPISLFATKDVLQSSRIHEGEPVFFTGFFHQFPGFTRIEPIVRQGIVAMMPDEQIPFVGQPERLYLADVHAFGGNSGSPAFINLGGMHEGNISAAQEYRLLGIVNGEIIEDENFNLELTATMTRGTGLANSGISTIVPVDDLKALLDNARLQRMRDDAVAHLKPDQR